MALNIKDPETDRLARDLAAETGESITVATRRAIEDRLARVRARALVSADTDVIQEIIERGRRRTVIDDRPADEVLGYDEFGLPS